MTAAATFPVRQASRASQLGGYAVISLRCNPPFWTWPALPVGDSLVSISAPTMSLVSVISGLAFFFIAQASVGCALQTDPN